MNYWKPYHQELIVKYYWANLNNDKKTADECIRLLHPVLEQIARLCLKHLNINDDDDLCQDAVIRMVTYNLPRLKEHKLNASFQYLWISTKRILLNAIKKKNEVMFSPLTDDYIVEDNPDYEDNIKEMRQQILNELDRKIIEHSVINKTSTVFLINLKEYLILNEWDARGFNHWVQDKMNICHTTYSSVISRCGIRSGPFNEKLINN